jgi:tetratricopeptide (TPR) repeat protein
MLVDLSKVPMAEVLRRLSAERKSGDLEVRSGKVVKTVYFDHGRIVFAASNMKKDRLGEALLALGRITDEEFSRASALVASDQRRRFGEALVQAGVMDKREVGSAVSRQVKQIVVSLFAFTEGAASFVERACPIPLDYMVSLSLHRMLYMGIKAMKGADELVLSGLGNLDQWVKLSAVPPFPFGVRKCSADELEILEQAQRRVTLRRLGWGKGGLSPARLKAAYGLYASGVLEPADALSQADQPVVQMETSTFLLSALRTRPDPSAREALRLEVQEELQRSARLDREAWLRVSRTAPREEIIRALEEKMERYHALLDAVGDDASLRTDIELVLGRASTMLRLARTAPVAPAPAGARAPVSAPAEAAAAKPAPASVPGPPASAAAAATGPSASTSPNPAPAPATPEAAPEDSKAMAARMNDIQRYLMEGDVRMTVSDYANAVKVYQKLVDLEPDVPVYRLRLAIAMAIWPRTKKDAEREFLEAVRLDPDNPDLHYQLGLYYKAMRVKSRAIAVFQTAVRLNPRHRQAREELESLSPKDSTLSGLRKLFR